MLDIDFGTHSSYTLSRALLIYEDTSKNAAPVITLHSVDCSTGTPLIGPGRTPSITALRRAMAQMSLSDANVNYLPRALIAQAPNFFVWWTPEARRKIWFSIARSNGEALQALNGTEVWMPPLVFIADNAQLHVHALATNQRPEPHSPLYVAPFYNLYDTGNLCIGTAPVPKTPSLDTIADAERAFFGSFFTHSNYHACRIHDMNLDHAAFWSALATAKRPPRWSKLLTDRKKTLDEVIAAHLKPAA